MMNSMRFGGIEKALLNFLEVLDQETFEVTILFVRKDGEYLHQIPPWVKIEEVDIPYMKRTLVGYGSKDVVVDTLKKAHYISTVKVIASYIKRKIRVNMQRNDMYAYKEVFKDLPIFKEHYDVALDFFGRTSFTTYYVSEKVQADIKATWIHSSDFNENIRNFRVYYHKYHRIFGVSKACVDQFIQFLPEYSTRCEVFYNIIVDADIIKKSQTGQGFEERFNGLKILTVGRLDVAKGYDVAIPIAAKLKEEGVNFKWYVIGEGLERKKLEKLIGCYHVADCFILIGSSDNPYPYMKECDIYVQPSRFEGYCITLAEARILAKPIITTNFFGAQEQIVDGETGLIVDCDKNQIYEAIKKLVANPQLRMKFKENLSKEKMNSVKEMNKLYALLD